MNNFIKSWKRDSIGSIESIYGASDQDAYDDQVRALRDIEAKAKERATWLEDQGPPTDPPPGEEEI